MTKDKGQITAPTVSFNYADRLSQMVNGYEALYRQIIKDRIESNGRIHAASIQF